MKDIKRKKTEALTLAMLLGAAAAILFSYFTAFSMECEKMQSRVFRLHIQANSDLAYDQQLKYDLRDAVMLYTAQLFKDAENSREAMAIAEKNAGEIEKRAADFIKSQGYDYKVKAEVANVYFTTRRYGNYTLPAGHYDALRLIIGEGEGKNWWCVMYPPLCLPACNTGEPVFTQEESKAIEEGKGIEFKFAAYELIQELVNKN